jgi:RecJ-like exonuclease
MYTARQLLVPEQHTHKTQRQANTCDVTNLLPKKQAVIRDRRDVARDRQTQPRSKFVAAEDSDMVLCQLPDAFEVADMPGLPCTN